MNKTRLYKTLIIVVCFLVYKYSKYLYGYLVFGKERWNNWPDSVPSSIMLLTGILMAFMANYWLNRRFSLKDFGIAPGGFLKGLVAAIMFCLPMFLCLGMIYHFNFQPTLEIAYRGILLAGFGEEFIFRAFLFGLLFFYAGWGFLSAGIFTGLFFGSGHLYQADNFGSAVSIFLFTTGASVGFAWFYYAWKSLWMVVFLHGFMDVIWDSFQVETNVTGNFLVNIARFSTIIFAIIYSIKIAKENKRYDLKNKLWINKST
jgi:membrane protease YdiL (CAAX protease family)